MKIWGYRNILYSPKLPSSKSSKYLLLISKFCSHHQVHVAERCRININFVQFGHWENFALLKVGLNHGFAYLCFTLMVPPTIKKIVSKRMSGFWLSIYVRVPFMVSLLMVLQCALSVPFSVPPSPWANE